ncbi:hypothetical protein C0Q70_03516 [Pomacea canaliculata]|uniref:Cytochrome P450 n=1 Tax=Pomacea canaliculata TaxID=400727 RepID=A0A2T7PSY0_POMCA|nr:hypothetical protein C0Q70_03516 [Pomacea canaliculata]
MCRTIIGNFCFLNSARLVRQVFTNKEIELVSNDRPKMFTAAQVMYNFNDVSFSDQVNNIYWLKMRKLLHSTVMFYGSGVENFSVQQITGEEQSPDSKVPQMIGDFAVCAQKILTPTVDSILSIFPFLRFLPVTYYKELFGNTLKCRDMLMEEVFTKGKAKHVPGEPKGMVGSLLEAQMKNSNDWLTDDHIRAMLLDIIAAAFVTSTELLKSFFLYMAHYPQVMKKIQQEIDSTLGHRSPSLDDRRSFPFMEAAILEVIRSTSNVPLGVWHETREDILTDGFCIPRGTVVRKQNCP